MVGVMIIITVVFIYAQVHHHGIHLVIVLLGYVKFYVHRTIMLIIIQEHDNVLIHALELMIILVMLLVPMIHMVTMIQTDVYNIV
jgi:hypothetical protein